MIAVAYLFGTVAVITAALLWRAIVLLERARFDRDENAAEIDRLEKAYDERGYELVRQQLRNDLAVVLAASERESRRFVEQERNNAYLSLELVLLEAAS